MGKIEFNDTSKNTTEPLILHQTINSLTSLDPIKGNDGSINTLNTNMYVRLVNLTDTDEVVSDGSLSYNHVMAEGIKNITSFYEMISILAKSERWC